MPRALFASSPTRLRRFEQHFTPNSRSRGITYAAQGRVEVCDANDTWLAATVRGSREYDVDLELDGGRVIASCTCPFADSGEPCKHVWATLVVGEAEGGRCRGWARRAAWCSARGATTTSCTPSSPSWRRARRRPGSLW